MTQILLRTVFPSWYNETYTKFTLLVHIISDLLVTRNYTIDRMLTLQSDFSDFCAMGSKLIQEQATSTNVSVQQADIQAQLHVVEQWLYNMRDTLFKLILWMRMSGTDFEIELKTAMNQACQLMAYLDIGPVRVNNLPAPVYPSGQLNPQQPISP